jgi:phosphate transport system substrate-binding protein
MKKIVPCVIALLLMLSLVACNKSSNSGGDSTNTPPSSTPSDKPSGNGSVEMPEMKPPMPLPEYPIIDGSSSTITMHAAIRAYLLDEYLVDQHSQTYGALERLVPGNENPADVLLSVKYYDDTLQDLKNRGADLVITPVAKEGFVFFVHEDNPIDSLTQQQIRDIYSGKITNWKEIGGKDEKIKLVSRNINSGSQTAMLDFMNGVPLANDDDVLYAGSMGDALTAVMLNGSAAIGYNIYSWSMEQGVSDMHIKTVVVDGVAPSNDTLADNSYPLLVYTYSYYNKGNDKSEAFTDWLLSAEGQKVIASAGYVGIFGEVSADKPIDFNKDAKAAAEAGTAFYMENGWDFNVLPKERISDKSQIEALASGKGKAVTVLWLFDNSVLNDDSESIYTRFIVLTREKGGAFEVINEGEVLSYIDGVITPGNTENHNPPKAAKE